MIKKIKRHLSETFINNFNFKFWSTSSESISITWDLTKFVLQKNTFRERILSISEIEIISALKRFSIGWKPPMKIVVQYAAMLRAAKKVFSPSEFGGQCNGQTVCDPGGAPNKQTVHFYVLL